jgi:hypothetical protein
MHTTGEGNLRVEQINGTGTNSKKDDSKVGTGTNAVVLVLASGWGSKWYLVRMTEMLDLTWRSFSVTSIPALGATSFGRI